MPASLPAVAGPLQYSLVGASLREPRSVHVSRPRFANPAVFMFRGLASRTPNRAVSPKPNPKSRKPSAYKNRNDTKGGKRMLTAALLFGGPSSSSSQRQPGPRSRRAAMSGTGVPDLRGWRVAAKSAAAMSGTECRTYVAGASRQKARRQCPARSAGPTWFSGRGKKARATMSGTECRTYVAFASRQETGNNVRHGVPDLRGCEESILRIWQRHFS
jgi:hypothetical protein